MKGILPGRGESKEKSLGIPSVSKPTLYYTSLWPGPSPGILHQSWPPMTLDIAYYSDNMTLNIECCKSCSVSTLFLRVFWGQGSGDWIGRCWGSGGLGVALRGGIRWSVGVEGEHGSVGDHWNSSWIGRTPRCFWNRKEVGVGRTPESKDCLQKKMEVIPWQLHASYLYVITSHLHVIINKPGWWGIPVVYILSWSTLRW